VSPEISAPASHERIGWLERRGDDFPYYRGRPVTITAGGWWLVIGGVALGLAVLLFGPGVLPGTGGRFAAAILYFAVPLAALALVAGRGWTAIFRPLRSLDWLLMAGFAVLNIGVTLVTGRILISVMETTANAAMGSVGQMAGAERLAFFARTALQLFGEEVMSVLPFLALLTWLSTGRGMSRKAAIALSALIVALLFAAEHLPTYGWNVPQAVLGVGVARIVLLLPYIATKNIWVSTGAHILNDWAMFGVSILSAATGAQTEGS
jgi:membrane protease YdiL (CAAX protease family)